MEVKGKICPVCGYNQLSETPYDRHGYPSYEICDCCGFEYGVTDDDQGFTFQSYRKKWIEEGCPYFGRDRPKDWTIEKAKEQLLNIESV